MNSNNHKKSKNPLTVNEIDNIIDDLEKCNTNNEMKEFENLEEKNKGFNNKCFFCNS